MCETQIYPIGQQDFKVLREEDALYIDKTPFVEKIVRSKSRYYFLARPRRFGKSLFLSTLRYFFEGERRLFKGLYVDGIDWEWDAYPVLYLDLNANRYAGEHVLDSIVENLIVEWEAKYEVGYLAENLSSRFRNVIRAAHEKTGHKVVILVDEYDKPLVGNIHKSDDFEYYRAKLSDIYSNFKSSAEHIRLVFMTGVSRFSKLSVFSDLNNLNDISFDDTFADICGITEQELLQELQPGIFQLATNYHVTYPEMCRRLKQNYDGYRFAPDGSDIYNPWSVFNCLSKGRIGAYWNATGTATVVAETLYNADIDIRRTLNATWNIDDLAGLDILNADPTALLYQTGYLTIADFDLDTNRATLKVPNEEVRGGLFKDLLPLYVKVKPGNDRVVVDDLTEAILNGRPEEMMRSLDIFFAGIPYDLKIENENNFQNALYVLLTLLGLNVKAEMHTSDGRIDLTLETSRYIYIIELKYDASPEQALRQIKDKQYSRKFAGDSRHIFEIGVSFSSVTRRIEGWRID